MSSSDMLSSFRSDFCWVTFWGVSLSISLVVVSTALDEEEVEVPDDVVTTEVETTTPDVVDTVDLETQVPADTVVEDTTEDPADLGDSTVGDGTGDGDGDGDTGGPERAHHVHHFEQLARDIWHPRASRRPLPGDCRVRHASGHLEGPNLQLQRERHRSLGYRWPD